MKIQKPAARRSKLKEKELPPETAHIPLAGKKPRRGVSRGLRRQHLDERLRMLHERAMLLERELRELDADRFYRTCIFGSARIKPDSKGYTEVFTLARYLSWEGIDILTGGGPGLMEAANKGAKLGQQEKQTGSLSYGLSIRLEWEAAPNSHLDVKRHHQRFSSRLDDFMRLSHSIVVTPGGIGTVLELFFAWQLIQVKHIEERPIVLLESDFWRDLMKWLKDFALVRGLINEKDFNCICVVDSPEEAFEIISAHHKEFRKKNTKK